MDLRERRVAQIVRDFVEGFALSDQVARELRDGSLRFETVERWVDDDGQSVLYRLKENCHALFRVDELRPRAEVQAEELFDLAIGALFHEAMKFRESFYLTAHYGPRLQKMMSDGSASGELADAFWRVVEAGRRRTLEAAAESAALFRETRRQLRIVLDLFPESGAIARSLVDDPARIESVFQVPLAELLADVYGSAAVGLTLAIDHLIENGHYNEAQAILERDAASAADDPRKTLEYVRALASYYSGDSHEGVELLSHWAPVAADGPKSWSARARRVLAAVIENFESADERLAASARSIVEALPA